MTDTLAAFMERTDITPAEALQFYADQKNFEIVDGHVRILDNGAVASNALKHLSLGRLELKGDAELESLRAQLAERGSKIERLQVVERYVQKGETYSYGIRVGMESQVERITELTRQLDEALSVVPPLLFEAFDYGQFADDFDQPLAKPIRLAIRTMLSAVKAMKQ